ncbi:MAG TPA: hypothetical protein VGM69_14020 [Chloroflexota bacterium]
MPRRSDHVQQARLNRDLAHHLLMVTSGSQPAVADPALQWAVTASFYAAVHAVEAHFAQLGVHHQTHAQRERDMDRDATTPPAIRGDYRQLKAWSIHARYDCRQFTAQYVTTNLLPVLVNILTHFGI